MLGFGLVQAATACALVELDAGKEIGPLGAYRLALRRLSAVAQGPSARRRCLGSCSTATAVLIPIALWFAVRWAFLAQVVELEGASGVGALRRSGQLVRGRWLRVASLVGVGLVLALAAGPFVGALLIFVTHASLPLLNVVAGIVYALTMPFVAIATAYLYFDARVRPSSSRGKRGLSCRPRSN